MVPAVTDRPLMAGYGVPDDLDGVLPWEWARQRLGGSRCYWVSTADAAGRPHSMPVWGVWLDEPDAFWFSCAPTARKARNLQVNAATTVTTEEPTRLVSLEGVATRLSAGGDLDRGSAAFWEKYGAEMDRPETEVMEFLGRSAAFAVTPERAFGLIETPEDFGPRATRWRW